MSKASRRRRRERRDAEHREMLARHQRAVEAANERGEDVAEADVCNLDPVVTNEEILRIESVLRFLNRRVGTLMDLEAFRMEMIDRFLEERFICEPRVYEVTYTSGEVAYRFVPQLTGRVGDVDLERMKHDMVNDSLDLGEGGIIREDGSVQSAPHKTSLWIPPSARRTPRSG